MSEQRMPEHEEYKQRADRKLKLSRDAAWHARALEKAKKIGATGVMLPREVVANEDGSESVRFEPPVFEKDFDKTIKRKEAESKYHFQKAIQHGATAENSKPPSEIDLYEQENPRLEDRLQNDYLTDSDLERINREADSRIKGDIKFEKDKRFGDTEDIDDLG